MRLTRELRTWLGGTNEESTKTGRNTWAGTRDGGDLHRFAIIRLTVEGDPDPRTGYICDIALLDHLADTAVRKEIEAVPGEDRPWRSTLSAALAAAFSAAAENAPPGTALLSIELLLSPFTRFAIERGAHMMLKLTQSFEFSASHRLAIPTLSDSENRELFGKCSNPHGHGHNYVIEITVAGNADQSDRKWANIGSIDRIVRENVIEPFDHKNLNTECPDFSDLNPTVENIAAVIFARLNSKFDRCHLDRVRVWETPKTSAEVTRDEPRR